MRLHVNPGLLRQTFVVDQDRMLQQFVSAFEGQHWVARLLRLEDLVDYSLRNYLLIRPARPSKVLDNLCQLHGTVEFVADRLFLPLYGRVGVNCRQSNRGYRFLSRSVLYVVISKHPHVEDFILSPFLAALSFEKKV